MHGPGSWPDSEWAGALNRLSAAWRAGRVPGHLFNGTRARHLPAIAARGFRGSDGLAWCADPLRPERSGDMVHLGTPDVAAWYMHDTATGSGEGPGLVAVDLEGWMASRSRPSALMVDANSHAFPAFEALGAASADEVRSMMAEGETDWEAGLAFTGAVAPDAPRVPPGFLRCLGTPAELDAFTAGAASLPDGGPVHLGIARAWAANPWAAAGWSFDAAALGRAVPSPAPAR